VSASKFSLSPKQKASILESNKRLNIWEGAVRSGKTWGSLVRWIKFVGQEADHDADLLMIGRTERTIKRNVIRPLEMLCGNACAYNSGRAEVHLLGRTINVLGASDERAEGKLRGLTAAGCYGDEITLWPESVFKMMLSRLSTDNAKFFGSTNPDSPYHYLKTVYLDRKNELDMYTSNWGIDDNPYLPADFVRSLKKEFRGLWYKRFIDGLWVMAEGAVYDFWDEKEFVIHTTPDGDKKIRWGVAIDYGTGNPTCFILFGMRKGSCPEVWAEREYYYDSQAAGRQKTDSEYSADMRAFLQGVSPEVMIIDPSAASLKLQLRKDGFLFVKDAVNDVLDGIRTQANMLVSGRYALKPACQQTIKDYSAYLWDKNGQKIGVDRPLKQNDHTKDAERYFLHTLYGGDVLDYERFNQWR
jgi:PBSX family phage terminase large subunit